MANTIITKNSSTASAVPTSGDLVQGELAVNVTDKRLFTEDSGGTVVELGVNPTSITTGNLTATGTTTLAGASTSADITFGDNAKAIFGAGSDLQIYHDGSNSIIDDVGTGDLYILGTNIHIRNRDAAPDEDMAYFGADGTAKLYYDGAKKIETTSTGIDVTGNATFGDNDKAIFGAGSDLQIYHDGSASYIAETGTGPLNIQMESTSTAIGSGTALINFLAKTGASLHTAANLSIHQPATTEGVGDFRFSVGDGAGVLTEALRVNSTGIDVTGTVVADGLTVDGTISVSTASDVPVVIASTDSSANLAIADSVGSIGLKNYNGRLDIQVDGDAGTYTNQRRSASFSTNGDISFYEDTGTTAKFFWDASAESLGIGTTTHYDGSTKLTVAGRINISNGTAIGSMNYGGGSVVNMGSLSNHPLQLTTNNTTRMVIDTSGNVGIGADSPETKLHLYQPSGGTGFQITRSTTLAAGAALYLSVDSTSARVSGYGNLAFYTAAIGGSASERLRIDSSGNLLVGTTSAASPNTQKMVIKYQSTVGTVNSHLALVGDSATNGQGPQILFSESGDGQNFAGGTIGFVRTGSNSIGDLVFGTRESAGDSTTVATERVRITSAGDLLVNKDTGSNHTILKDVAVGSIILGISNIGQNTAMFYATDATGNSVANTGIIVRKVSATGRSINAAGTINASGADYAEYMTKAGDFAIAKGDVAGVNAEGKLTNIFADAVSFVVKSTDPSYVGGDVWFTEEKPEDESLVADWENRLEQARLTVDRIAFAGQVPVNVLGATAGQYIVPVNDNGSIKGQAVSNPTFEQYQSAVGKVIAVETDGRARIIVKVA